MWSFPGSPIVQPAILQKGFIFLDQYVVTHFRMNSLLDKILVFLVSFQYLVVKHVLIPQE